MSSVYNHKAVPLLTLEGEFYKVHKENLERIIHQNRVGDLPVSIVSIAGKFREGKSFFLNFCLRYLQSTNKADWLGDENQDLEGFEWKQSCEGITKGILIWSEIFKTRDSNGKEMAIMLMDTQGTFDPKSTERDNITIFGLSTLVSSLQIFNIKDKIDESSLQNLAHFSTYASLVKEKISSSPTLMFLVRDWCNKEEIPYGETGGRKYINSHFDADPTRNPDARKVRESIKEAFHERSCVLLPHPGFDATESADFSGSKRSLRGIFMENLESTISSIFGSGKLKVKQIDGKPIDCMELISFIDKYAQVYNGNTLPKMQQLFEVTITSKCDQVIKKVVKNYETSMESVMELDENKPYMFNDKLDDIHKVNEEAALDTFTEKLEGTFYHNEILEEKTTKLKDKLDKRVKFFESKNDDNRKQYKRKVLHGAVIAAAAATGIVLIASGGGIFVFGTASLATELISSGALALSASVLVKQPIKVHDMVTREDTYFRLRCLSKSAYQSRAQGEGSAAGATTDIDLTDVMGFEVFEADEGGDQENESAN